MQPWAELLKDRLGHTLKRVDFIRDYEIRDGIAFPRHLESTIQTRLVGMAKLDVRFRDFAKADADQASAQPAGVQ